MRERVLVALDSRDIKICLCVIKDRTNLDADLFGSMMKVTDWLDKLRKKCIDTGSKVIRTLLLLSQSHLSFMEKCVASQI